jgi:tetratricopeptide (TPR) repeat protein
VSESPGLVPGAFGVAVFIWFAADEAGFRGVTWYPASLLLVALLAVLLVTLPRPRPTRLALAAIALLAAYAAWSYLSILWADNQGIAWDGANRTVFYALVLALFALWPLRTGAATGLLVAYGLGVAAVGLVELLRVAAAANPIGFMPEGRLSEPAGYANANVALWFSAFWPCAILAARRELPVGLRGTLLGGAGLLAGLALLGQSRGWLYVLPLVVLVAVAVVPGRGRTIAALALIGGGVAVFLDPVLNVFDSFDRDVNVASQVDDATRAIVFVAVALAVLGALIAAAESRAPVSVRTADRANKAVVATFIAAVVVAAVAFFAVKGDPVSVASDAWDDFTDVGSFTAEDRFGGDLTSYRYDYWQVAWENFERAPIGGVGADNFLEDYLIRGRSYQQPSYPHSVEFRALSQTGLIGALLLAAGLGCALAGALRARAAGPAAGAAAGTGVVVFAYWMLHGSFDWLWEFAGLGGPAIAGLGLGLALAGGSTGAAPLRLPRGPVAAAAVLTAALAVGLTLPWLAERDLRKAGRIADVDPEGALDLLDRAASLNRLSATPEKGAGVILIRQGRLGEAEVEFREALERNPRDAYSYLQLGAIASQSGRREEAEGLLERASELAPRDGVIQAAKRRVLRGGELDVARLDAEIRNDIEVRLGRR